MTRPRAEYEEALRWVAMGLNDCQIERLTGVPHQTVQRWRMGRRGAPPSDCPICHGRALPEERYAYLLGLYLGDGTIVGVHRGVYRLEVCLDARYPEIIRECGGAMLAVLPQGRDRVGHMRRMGCVSVNTYWKHWPCVFPQHGPGMKHRRTIALAPWQEAILHRHPGSLLRGLIHSDGWRGMNRVRARGRIYEYARYQFTNHSDDIRAIFCRACDAFGVSWRQSNWRTFRYRAARTSRS